MVRAYRRRERDRLVPPATRDGPARAPRARSRSVERSTVEYCSSTTTSTNPPESNSDSNSSLHSSRSSGSHATFLAASYCAVPLLVDPSACRRPDPGPPASRLGSPATSIGKSRKGVQRGAVDPLPREPRRDAASPTEAGRRPVRLLVRTARDEHQEANTQRRTDESVRPPSRRTADGLSGALTSEINPWTSAHGDQRVEMNGPPRRDQQGRGAGEGAKSTARGS
jgi:hypothetical protein